MSLLTLQFSIDDAVELAESLPEEHAPILYYLLDFLAEVAQHSSSNKMSPANLGMVFGIVLIQPPDNSVTNVGSSMPKEVLTFLIEHVDEVFADDEEPSEDEREGSRKAPQQPRAGVPVAAASARPKSMRSDSGSSSTFEDE